MQENFKLQYTEVAGGVEWYKRDINTHSNIKNPQNQGINHIMSWKTFGDPRNIENGIEYFSDSMNSLSRFLYGVVNRKIPSVDILDEANRLIGKIFKDEDDTCSLSFGTFEVPTQYQDALKGYSYKKLLILNIEKKTKNSDANFKLVKNILFYSNNDEDIAPQDIDLLVLTIIEQIILNNTELATDPNIINKIIEKVIIKAVEKIRDKLIKKVGEYFQNLILEFAELEGVLVVMGAFVGALIYLVFDFIIYIISKLFLSEYCQTTLYLNTSPYPYKVTLGYQSYLDAGLLPPGMYNENDGPFIIGPTNVAYSFNSHVSGTKSKIDLTLYEVISIGFSIICYSGRGSWPIQQMKQVTLFQPPKELKDRYGFSNFINFSRYFDPAITQQIPPAIDIEFNLENCKAYAENYNKTSLTPERNFNIGTGILTLKAELSHIPKPDDDPNQRTYSQIYTIEHSDTWDMVNRFFNR